MREFNYFTDGQSYNLTCQVLGSRPAPLTNMWVGSRHLLPLDTQVSQLLSQPGLTKNKE